MTDYEKMDSLISNLLLNLLVTKYTLTNTISAKPAHPLFLSAPEWKYIYWNKDNFSKTYVLAGELSNFSSFCMCPFQFFSDDDKKKIISQIQTKLTNLYYNYATFDYECI